MAKAAKGPAGGNVVNLAFQVMAGGNLQKAVNQIGAGIGTGITAGAKKARAALTKLLAAGAKAGLEGGIIGAGRKARAIASRKAEATEMARQLQAAHDRGDAGAVRSISRRMKMETEALQELAARRASSMTEFTRLQRRQFEEVAEDFGSALEGIGGKVMGGDIGSLLKSLGQRTQRRGDVAATRGAEAGAGTGAKIMGQVGKSMAVVGKAMMGLGAVLGVVVMLAKAFIDLDSKVKEWNAAVAEGSGIADYGFGNATKAAREHRAVLDEVVETITKASADDKNFRELAADSMKVLAAMNEANYRWKDMKKEITGTNESMKSYVDITSIAIGYSKLLGLDMTETGRDMAKLANEWGVGLQTIAEGFSMIHREAMQSGFSVKRFYSTILEVTAGMGMYNVRVAEAAAVLKLLGNALGETVGADLFNSVSKGMKDMSTTDRMGEVLKRGGPGSEAMKSLFADVARANADYLFANIPKEALAKAGVKAKTAEEFAAEMAKMSPSRKLEIMGSLSSSGVEPEMLTKFSQMGIQFQAASGNFAAMTEAMKTMGPAATLAFLRKPGGPFGKKSVSEVRDEALRTGDPTMIAALEEIAKAAGMSLDELIQFDENLRIQWDSIGKLAEKAKKGDEEAAKTLLDMYQLAINPETGKLSSVKIDPATGAVAFGAAVENIEEYLLVANDETEGLAENVSEDILLSRQLAENTKGIENVLTDNLNYWLIQIHKKITDIYMYLREKLALLGIGEEDLAAEKAYAQAGDLLAEEEDAALSMKKYYWDEVDKASAAAKEKGVSPEQKDLYEKQAELYTDAADAIDKTLGDLEKTKSKLRGIDKDYTSGQAYIDAAAEAAGVTAPGGVDGRGGTTGLHEAADAAYEAARDSFDEQDWDTVIGQENRDWIVGETFNKAYAAGGAMGNFPQEEQASIKAEADAKLASGEITTGKGYRDEILRLMKKSQEYYIAWKEEEAAGTSGRVGIEKDLQSKLDAANKQASLEHEQRARDAGRAAERTEFELGGGKSGTTINVQVNSDENGVSAEAEVQGSQTGTENGRG